MYGAPPITAGRAQAVAVQNWVVGGYVFLAGLSGGAR